MPNSPFTTRPQRKAEHTPTLGHLCRMCCCFWECGSERQCWRTHMVYFKGVWTRRKRANQRNTGRHCWICPRGRRTHQYGLGDVWFQSRSNNCKTILYKAIKAHILSGLRRRPASSTIYCISYAFLPCVFLTLLLNGFHTKSAAACEGNAASLQH